MQKKITIESLNQIALEASTNKYTEILSKLEKNARKGRNGINMTEVPEIVISRLKKEGYTVTSHFIIKSNFLFRRKVTKYYHIRFIRLP